jgi:hypothetical protein
MDLTKACNSFPLDPTPSIARENIMVAIEEIFKGGTNVVTIEGIDGIGKTTLLAQFSQRHPQNAFSLFLDASSPRSYDPFAVRLDLCNQLEFLVNGKEIQDPRSVDDAYLNGLLFQVQRRTRNRRAKFYFVIDGLDDVLHENAHIAEAIKGYLPIGYPQFFFLASRTMPKRDSIPFSKHTEQPLILTPFTLGETESYFRDLEIDRVDIREIYGTCRGMPGSLSSAYRTLATGKDVRQFIDNMPAEMPGLFKIEWSAMEGVDDLTLDIVAVVTFANRDYTVAELAAVLHTQPDVVQGRLEPLGFILRRGDQVAFVTDAFRKFAAHELRSHRRRVHEILVSHLRRDPNGDDALRNLPSYLSQGDRFGELIDYLSPSHFVVLLEQTQSLAAVRQHADLGVRTALELHRDADLLRFAIQRSLLAEHPAIEALRSEIEARISLGDYARALALAQGAPLKEDRLHLLSILAKGQHEANGTVDAEIIEQIRVTYDQIDYQALGKKAIDIASDLIYAGYALAIELVEKATSGDSQEGALDWAFARLSLATSGRNDEPLQPDDAIDNIASRISDPDLRRFATAASSVFESFSPQEIINRADRLDNVGDKLYMLRRWAVSNHARPDAYDVINHAVNLAIRTNEYASTARVFREIASPVPSVAECSDIISLLGIFDSQRAVIEQLGPTEEYIRLQLLLSHGEARCNFENAAERIIEIYYYIGYIEVGLTQLSQRAWNE